MGWLEGWVSNRWAEAFHCFNSTMGWLEEITSRMIWSTREAFQFHYGMIGSPKTTRSWLVSIVVSIPLWDDWKSLTCSVSTRAMLVSIPLWDDWKRPDVKILSGVCTFQFHYGMIGSGRFYSDVYVRDVVSIPLWDDWKTFVVSIPEETFHVSIPLWDDWKGSWTEFLC